ncbi:MAG: DUF4157 domain-containing protein [Nostoc sp. DedQUE12a]|nr:DUF4157 domain-containing protein [Nostoc sp. DedQUE12a]
MKHQHLSQIKNAIASSNRENASSQLTVRVASRTEGIARSSAHPIEELQGAIGNQAVNQLLANQPTVQTKPMFRGLSEELPSPSPIQAQLAKETDSASFSEVQPENKTGLPDQLKAGIENFSGLAMDDVRVHYNSSKPAELQALAYTQGTDIHVAPGQEQHLPHEAWHVVQQKQGRVKPTIQAKGVGINDDKGLEKEADVMGAKAVQGEQVQVAGAGTRLSPSVGLDAGRVVQCGKTPGLLKTPARKLKGKLLALQGVVYYSLGYVSGMQKAARKIKRINEKLLADERRRNPQAFRYDSDSSSNYESEEESPYDERSGFEEEESFAEEEKLEIKEGNHKDKNQADKFGNIVSVVPPKNPLLSQWQLPHQESGKQANTVNLPETDEFSDLKTRAQDLDPNLVKELEAEALLLEKLEELK